MIDRLAYWMIRGFVVPLLVVFAAYVYVVVLAEVLHRMGYIP